MLENRAVVLGPWDCAALGQTFATRVGVKLMVSQGKICKITGSVHRERAVNAQAAETTGAPHHH